MLGRAVTHARTLAVMTRELRTVLGVDATWRALRGALTADGPAILPRAEATGPDSAPGELPPPATVDRTVSLVIETSGSSGQPKRVALSANAVLASAAASSSALGGNGQWLLAVPSHYIAGINVLVRSLVAEIDPVVIAPGPFTVASFVHAVSQLDGPTAFTSLVPAQLVRLLAEDDGIRALRRFERVLVGGQATPERVIAEAREAGVRVTRTYGSSETSGGCVYDGEPIGQTRMRLSDGQIELSGPTLAEGYLADPARTAASFVVDDGTRWYRTGDAGSIVDGVLSVTGRLDDVIISGGIKVSLGAIQQRVREIPGLAGAVIIAGESRQWGEVPVVISTVAFSLDELRSAVEDNLGPAARPARVEIVDDIPTLASGKPNLQLLRELYGRDASRG